MASSIAMKIYCRLSIVSLVIAAARCTMPKCPAKRLFRETLGLQCLRPEFVLTYQGLKCVTECALLCDRVTDCQAFSMADGPCQLFVFNRCSKYVRDCSCTRIKQVFVKQQSGLPPGTLCPAGFADDFCGTKYKLYENWTDWDLAKEAVDALPGLTIMADVTDQTEMGHLQAVFNRDRLMRVIMGGMQLPGSSEPAGGWIWASCNLSISADLWAAKQPSNAGIEDVVVAGSDFLGLNDGKRSKSIFEGAFVECVSPFN